MHLLQESRLLSRFILHQKLIPVTTAALRYRSTVAAEAAYVDEAWETAKPFSKIPGPKSYPLIKNTLYNIFKLPVKFTSFYSSGSHLRERYGDLVRWELPFSHRMLLISDPKLMEDFIKKGVTEWPERLFFDTLYKYRTQYRKDEYEGSGGVIVEQGQKWYDIRSKVQKTMMRPKSSSIYVPAMAEVAQELIERIRYIRDNKNKVPKDFQNDLYKWALESVGVVALNTRFGCLAPNLPPDSDGQIMITSVHNIFECACHLEFTTPFWKLFPTKKWREFIKHSDNIARVGKKYIERAIAALEGKNTEHVDELNMLERFLLTPGLSKVKAYTMAIDMLFAGIDTTGNSTGFLLYFLAKNPVQQKKAQEEIDRVFPDPNLPLTAKGIDSLSYLKACIKESLRMLPVASAFLRDAQKDFVLNGFKIPKGTTALFNTMIMCNSEKYYPDPLKFKPERWLRTHPEQTNASRYTFMPFGHGTRMCIGKRIAEQEMTILSTKLLQNFNMEYHGKDMGITPRFVNVPSEPLQFIFTDRKRSVLPTV